jgi:hypothetical protein
VVVVGVLWRCRALCNRQQQEEAPVMRRRAFRAAALRTAPPCVRVAQPHRTPLLPSCRVGFRGAVGRLEGGGGGHCY